MFAVPAPFPDTLLGRKLYARYQQLSNRVASLSASLVIHYLYPGDRVLYCRSVGDPAKGRRRVLEDRVGVETLMCVWATPN